MDALSGQQFRAEVTRFQVWATAYPHDQRGSEWECNYERWRPLSNAFLAFVDNVPFARWSAEEQAAVLYTIARDNEIEYLIREIGKRSEELLMNLAEVSLLSGESDAKWQFAAQLGNPATDNTRQEALLLNLATDEDEIVRRHSLGSLARIGSPATERLAVEAWSREDESQQWARMMALWALRRVGSPLLELMLKEAERDERPYLSAYAAKIRSGDVEA